MTGVIGGDDNAFGILGICPEANVRAISIFGVGQETAKAIFDAANALSQGDIILIELHAPGPHYNFQYVGGQLGYVAMEFWPDNFAAIVYATAVRGVIVVEAAGNGSENYDDPLYDVRPAGFPLTWLNPFNPANPQSGAILVGAGAPPPGTHGRNHGADRSRLGFSNYGVRVDAQGWGREVTTAAYGDLQGGVDENLWYTDVFGGTSSASPIVVGAVGCLQGALRAANQTLLNPDTARSILRTTGSPQQDEPGRPASQRIGNRPDLMQAMAALGLDETGGEKEDDSPCRVRVHNPKPDCVSPKGLPWLPYDQCITFFEDRIIEEPTKEREVTLQFRITYRHCLRLRGRKQGPLAFTVTLLPGEELRLYHFDRYRRTRAERDTYSVHTSFRQYVSALSRSREAVDYSKARSIIADARTDSESDPGVFGFLFGFGESQSSARVSSIYSVSVHSVAEQFNETVITASQAVETERSVTISTYEDKEQVNVTSRLVRNENRCRAVTYFVRRVFEVYTLFTQVVRIEYRITGPKGQSLSGGWRDVSDFSGLNNALVQLIKAALKTLPQLGQIVELNRETTLPTDGTVYEAELAHCCSCEPQKVAEYLVSLEKAKAEAKKLCMESELLRLEALRRESLITAGRLEPFEPTPELQDKTNG